jgi:hypothetical protein
MEDNQHFVLFILIHKAIRSQESFPGELKFLHSTVIQNGYSERQIHHSFNPSCTEDTSRKDLTVVGFLHFVGKSFNSINRMLSRCNIKTVGLPTIFGPSRMPPV